MTHFNPMLNQIQPAGLLVGSACGPGTAAPRNNSIFEKCPTVEESARHGQDHRR